MNQEFSAKEIFLKAIEFDSPEEQAAFVRSNTFGDVDLQRRIADLLVAHRDSEVLRSDHFSGANEVGSSRTIENDTVVLSDSVPEYPNSESSDVDGSIRNSATRQNLERFQKRKLHAKGGFGEVFVALDVELHRDVALKEVQLHCANNSSAIRRFVFEAEVMGGLEHPGIVPVYAFGTYSDGRPFYAMKFVQGEDLQQACGNFHKHGSTDYDSLEFRKLLQRFIDVCNTIAYAHSRGIIHRDIKPGNIMLGRFGETLVVDWGLAKKFSNYSQSDIESSGTLTFSSDLNNVSVGGDAIGTPAYMSPEQAEGRIDSLDARTDVYSLGATLFFILVGKAPFSGTLLDVLEKVRKSEFPKARSISPQVPKVLDAVLNVAKQWQTSEPVLREALELHQSLQSKEMDTLFTQVHLGYCVAMQDRKSEAEPLVRNGILGLIEAAKRSAPGSNENAVLKRRMPDVIQHVIASERAMGNIDAAEKWEASVSDFKEWSANRRVQVPSAPVGTGESLP